MIIERNSTHSLLPQALEILACDFRAPIYNSNYGKRHPLGIYNLSLTEVWASFKEVLDELERVQNLALFRDRNQYGWDVQLLEKQQKLLYTIMSHFDDCISILRCFYAPIIGNNKKKFDKEPVVANFKQSIGAYRTNISEIVNHLKHHQGRLRAIFVFTDQYVIPGYFVEGVDETGVVGPYEKIHPLYYNKATAFSFARNLKYHFWGIYMVSAYLHKALKLIVGTSFILKSLNGPNDSFLDVMHRIALEPYRFFPDEIQQPIPSIKLLKDADEVRLRLEYPGEEITFPLPNKADIWISWIGDGVSTSYKLPYLYQ